MSWMGGLFCAACAPDEKNHYHNDTSNYTVIRICLRFAVGLGALPLDNMIQETGKAGRPGRHLTLSLDAHSLHPQIMEPKSVLPTWHVKCVQTSDTCVAVRKRYQWGDVQTAITHIIRGISTLTSQNSAQAQPTDTLFTVERIDLTTSAPLGNKWLSNSALVFLILMCVYKSKIGYCRVKGIGQCVCPQKGAAQRRKV